MIRQQQVASGPIRREGNARIKEGEKDGGQGNFSLFFFFSFFFKVAQKVSVEGRGEKEPANTPTLPLLL